MATDRKQSIKLMELGYAQKETERSLIKAISMAEVPAVELTEVDLANPRRIMSLGYAQLAKQKPTNEITHNMNEVALDTDPEMVEINKYLKVTEEQQEKINGI